MIFSSLSVSGQKIKDKSRKTIPRKQKVNKSKLINQKQQRGKRVWQTGTKRWWRKSFPSVSHSSASQQRGGLRLFALITPTCDSWTHLLLFTCCRLTLIHLHQADRKLTQICKRLNQRAPNKDACCGASFWTGSCRSGLLFWRAQCGSSGVRCAGFRSVLGQSCRTFSLNSDQFWWFQPTWPVGF